MIGPRPQFMGTKEWNEHKAHDSNDDYFELRLKHGSPEWLQKEFTEYRNTVLSGYKESGYLTQDEYEAAINKSVFCEVEVK